MIQTPFGGLSLIINLIIIAFSLLINYFKKTTLTHAVISHKHIFELESTKIGRVITPLLAFSIPLFIFTVVLTTSLVTVRYLYNDTHKLTIYDVGVLGEGLAEDGYRYIENRSSQEAIAYVGIWKEQDTRLSQAGTPLKDLQLMSNVHSVYSSLYSKDILYKPNAIEPEQFFVEGLVEEKNFIEKINKQLSKNLTTRITNN